MAEQGIPIHRGYYIEDLRTVELGWWEARQCQAAFIQLLGQQGVSEARVSEVPPGQTLPPVHLGIDEVVYVLGFYVVYSAVRNAGTGADSVTQAFHHAQSVIRIERLVNDYPQPNPNEGFRKISVEVASDLAKKYRVQCRPGYRPRGGF